MCVYRCPGSHTHTEEWTVKIDSDECAVYLSCQSVLWCQIHYRTKVCQITDSLMLNEDLLGFAPIVVQ